MAQVRKSDGTVVEVPDEDVWGPAKTQEQINAERIPLIKAEAYRRIVAIVPEWRQRNLLAQASLLAEKGRDNWSTAETAAWEAGEAVWSQVAAIRAASDVLEAMEEIPADFTDDSYWP